MTLTSRMPVQTAAFALALALALPGPIRAQEGGSAAEDAQAAETQAAETQTDGTETAGDPLEGLSAETVIATVGDYELTLGELIAVRRALPQQYQSLPPEVLFEGLTEQLVNQTILAVQARRAGTDERPEVVYNLRNLENSQLADSYMRAAMQERLNEEVLEAAYEERYADAEPVEEIRASHILVETEEAAQALKDQIDEGADFAELAKEHGTDGTAPRGGDLGWFVKEDMVPDFANAAFALESGTVSGPVETPFGWHLIKLVDRRDRPAPPIEEVREELLQTLAGEMQQEILETAKQEVEVTFPETEIPPAALLADRLLSGESGE